MSKRTVTLTLPVFIEIKTDGEDDFKALDEANQKLLKFLECSHSMKLRHGVKITGGNIFEAKDVKVIKGED